MRHWTRTKTIRLSVCDCGFNTLADHIALGTEYEVDLDDILPGFQYTCGGCGLTFNVEGIAVKEREGTVGWMPTGLFDL